jgi:hypothetical protein
MDWDQIENKWAAMTRRVRADWCVDSTETKPPMPRRMPRTEVTPASVAGRQTDAAPDTRLKTSVE